jgi:hypothetical protein
MDEKILKLLDYIIKNMVTKEDAKNFVTKEYLREQLTTQKQELREHCRCTYGS